MKQSRLVSWAPAAIAVAVGAEAFGQKQPYVGTDGLPRAVALAQPRLPPVPGALQELRALIMEVNGVAQWRADEEGAWRDAKVNDVLRPGAEIRTGLRSSVALRVGRNSTVLVDRSTRLSLPVIVRDGETLRTRTGLLRGRADFKVDVIGLTNDYEVLTPTTTLTVRGTGFAVGWGALAGVDVRVLSADVLAVEARYLLRQLRYLLATRAVSREGRPDPVVAALFETFELPLPSMTQQEYLAQLTDDAFLQNPTLRRVENATSGQERVKRIIDELSPEVRLICDNVNEFFGDYRMSLAEELGFESFSQLADFFGLMDDVAAFCEGLDSFQGDPLEAIDTRVTAFCQSYDRPEDVERCRSLFHELLMDQLGP